MSEIKVKEKSSKAVKVAVRVGSGNVQYDKDGCIICDMDLPVVKYFEEIYNKKIHPTSWPVSKLAKKWDKMFGEGSLKYAYYGYCLDNGKELCKHGFVKGFCDYCKYGTE